MADVNYREGDWFAVPLRDGGYALGVIARSNPKGALLGFFFGPKRAEVPSLAAVVGLTPADAILVERFGHLGLVNGDWLNLGPVAGWHRSLWSSTAFGHREPLGSRCFKVIYDDDDPAKRLRTEAASADEIDRLPRDGLSGAAAVETILTKLLG